MKKIVNVTEVEGEGLVALLGEKVILMCMNYHYVGTLKGVNETDVVLDEKDAAVCYETGEWSAKEWKDAQKIGHDLYVRVSAIEAYFAAGK
jgi:hypothetical protein